MHISIVEIVDFADLEKLKVCKVGEEIWRDASSLYAALEKRREEYQNTGKAPSLKLPSRSPLATPRTLRSNDLGKSSNATGNKSVGKWKRKREEGLKCRLKFSNSLTNMKEGLVVEKTGMNFLEHMAWARIDL